MRRECSRFPLIRENFSAPIHTFVSLKRKKMIERIAFLYRAYRYRYRIDPAEIRYVLANLKPGDTAVDVGCHKGGYMYWMQRRVGERGRIFAFEPQPKLFAYLRGVQQQFGFKNVQLEHKGLSSASGVMELHVPASASGTSPGATLNRLAETDGAALTRCQVEVTTLDDYFHARNIRPALLKIDVEGHELEVLKGGRQLLTACKPRILMECENRHMQEGSVEDVFDFLRRLGYDGHFIERGRLRPLQEFDPHVHQRSGEGRFWEEKGYVNNFVFA
jgi:FkbM family methyltransferase